MRGKRKTIGTADMNCIHYTTRRPPLKTDCFIKRASWKVVRSNKFWNKIHGWFRSHFLLTMAIYTITKAQNVLKAVYFWKWLRICLAWHNSNKIVSLSFKQQASCSLGVMRYGCYANGFRFNSHLADFQFFLAPRWQQQQAWQKRSKHKRLTLKLTLTPSGATGNNQRGLAINYETQVLNG